jgi:phosphatidylinositol glycan class W
VALVLWAALQSRQRFFTRQAPLTLAVDFLLNVTAILLAITLYSSQPLLLNILLVTPALLVYALPPAKARSKKVKPPGSNGARAAEPLDDLPMKPFLTAYRGSMMVITCLAILAVDFRIFPRRFAKVETWGTSLMDVGVGSFVFSAGMVAARPVLKEKISGKRKSLASRLHASLRHSLPLFVLGFIRLYSVKGLDYQEHVTEYGVHWNFFFTLALLPPFVALFESAFYFVPSFAVMAVVVGICYEVLLEFTSIKAFILTAPRTDLLSKNREGVFSFVGYLAIFLLGQATGMYAIPRRIANRADLPPALKGISQRQLLLAVLAGWTCIWSLLYTITTSYQFGLSLTASRRLANLPYILWIAAFNCGQLTAYCAVEETFFPGSGKSTERSEEKAAYDFATSRVLAAYNGNGLAIFLLANLLTGLINLTVPTLHVTNVEAMAILLAYASVLTCFAVGLDMYNIRIKL